MTDNSEISDIKVSVIVPIFNGAQFITETVQSVFKQSHKNWELIIIDDGSTDNSVEVIKDLDKTKKIRLLHHPDCKNEGVSKTRQLGVQESTGEYIAFLDADDLFYPEKLSDQLEIFLNNPQVSLVHSKVELLNESALSFTNKFDQFEDDIIYDLCNTDNWLVSNFICNSTVMVKSSILKKIKFGIPQLFQYEDWLLWNLVAQKGLFYYQDMPQIKYRLHEQSATSAILKNNLISPYSKIELLISFYCLNINEKENFQIAQRIKEALLDLTRVYSNNNSEIVGSFKFNFDSERNSRKKLSLKKIINKIKGTLN